MSPDRVEEVRRESTGRVCPGHLAQTASDGRARQRLSGRGPALRAESTERRCWRMDPPPEQPPEEQKTVTSQGPQVDQAREVCRPPPTPTGGPTW